MNKNTTKNYVLKKAFTVVELVIALIIFWSWLLVILVILNKNVLISKQIELRSNATFLAKEWIEIVFNKRDSNNIKYQPWNYIDWDLTNSITTDETYFEKSKNYKVWTSFSWNKNYMEEFCNIQDAKLYLKTWEILNWSNEVVYSWFYYNYDTGNETWFTRYVNFTWVYLEPEWNSLNQDVMKLNSIVKYNWWWISWWVVLESFITNWK